MLLCVDDCLVCRSICSCIPDSHPHRATHTRCRIDTVSSPDDGNLSGLLFTNMNFYAIWVLLVNKIIEQWIVYWLIRLLNSELCILVIVNILRDPKNVNSFIIGWFIVKAWWWPSKVETCCDSNHNKLVDFDGKFLILIIFSENTSGWLPLNLWSCVL